jgi:hypothetical protein
MRAALPRLDCIDYRTLLADTILNVVEPRVESVTGGPQPIAISHFLNNFLPSMFLLDYLPPRPPTLHHRAFLPQPAARPKNCK